MPLLLDRFHPGHATLALGACLLALAVPAVTRAAPQPVLVYQLTFEARRGQNVDLDFFDGGYFAGPALGGLGTFIFTVDDGPDERFFTVAPLSGRIFTAFNEGNERCVIATADVFDTGFSTYLLLGEKEHTLRLPGATLTVAQHVEGSCLAADDESALDEHPGASGRGFAGIVDIHARLQNGYTLRTNRPGAGGVEGAVALLVKALEDHGFVNLNSTEPALLDREELAAERRNGTSGDPDRVARTETPGAEAQDASPPRTDENRPLYSLWLKSIGLVPRDREDGRRFLP